jgi:hypothetical protein
MDDKAGMGKWEGDFYLPGHPATMSDGRGTATNGFIAVNPAG